MAGLEKSLGTDAATAGFGGLTVDAWGHPVGVQLQSVFHGMWTFDIPQSMWIVEEDGSEVVPASVTAVTSIGGAANLDTTGFTSCEMRSKRHPRYQPNRGHRYSTALWCPDSTNDGVREWGLFTADNGVFFRLKADGKLYAVVKSGGVEDENEIDTSSISGFDVEKGNVYDIQFQWRGVGNYKFFINLELVYTYNYLGTRTSLTMENPALPASYKCTNTTADVVMNIGCVDVTSEGGEPAREQYGSAYGQGIGNQTDYPNIGADQNNFGSGLATGGVNIFLDSEAETGGNGSPSYPYDTFADINWTTGGTNSIFDWVAAGDDVYINLQGGVVLSLIHI